MAEALDGVWAHLDRIVLSAAAAARPGGGTAEQEGFDPPADAPRLSFSAQSAAGRVEAGLAETSPADTFAARTRARLG